MDKLNILKKITIKKIVKFEEKDENKAFFTRIHQINNYFFRKILKKKQECWI